VGVRIEEGVPLMKRRPPTDKDRRLDNPYGRQEGPDANDTTAPVSSVVSKAHPVLDALHRMMTPTRNH
jgi:hypothetical protein